VIVPPYLPRQLAELNVRYGVPCHGAFSPYGPSPGQLAGWTLAIPWAIILAGALPGRNAIVAPPTLPGLAWLLEALGARACLFGSHHTALQVLNSARGAAVVCLDSAPEGRGAGAFTLAFRLDPYGPLPAEEELDRVAHWLAPGGRLVLAWSVTLGEDAAPPPGWRAAPRAAMEPEEVGDRSGFRTEQGTLLSVLAVERAP